MTSVRRKVSGKSTGNHSTSSAEIFSGPSTSTGVIDLSRSGDDTSRRRVPTASISRPPSISNEVIDLCSDSEDGSVSRPVPSMSVSKQVSSGETGSRSSGTMSRYRQTDIFVAKDAIVISDDDSDPIPIETRTMSARSRTPATKSLDPLVESSASFHGVFGNKDSRGVDMGRKLSPSCSESPEGGNKEGPEVGSIRRAMSRIESSHRLFSESGSRGRLKVKGPSSHELPEEPSAIMGVTNVSQREGNVSLDHTSGHFNSVSMQNLDRPVSVHQKAETTYSETGLSETRPEAGESAKKVSVGELGKFLVKERIQNSNGGLPLQPNEELNVSIHLPEPHVEPPPVEEEAHFMSATDVFQTVCLCPNTLARVY